MFERVSLNAKLNDLIFQSLNGTPLSRNNIMKRNFKPCLLKAGLAIEEVTEEGETRIISKFRMYDLRHTHATILLRANVNPKIVSERLGHASVALTLDVYSHVLPTMQSSAVAAIANALYSKDEEGDILPLN